MLPAPPPRALLDIFTPREKGIDLAGKQVVMVGDIIAQPCSTLPFLYLSRGRAYAGWSPSLLPRSLSLIVGITLII